MVVINLMIMCRRSRREHCSVHCLVTLVWSCQFILSNSANNQTIIPLLPRVFLGHTVIRFEPFGCGQIHGHKHVHVDKYTRAKSTVGGLTLDERSHWRMSPVVQSLLGLTLFLW